MRTKELVKLAAKVIVRLEDGRRVSRRFRLRDAIEFKREYNRFAIEQGLETRAIVVIRP